MNENEDNKLEALPVHNRGTSFIILSLRDPHLRRKNRKKHSENNELDPYT